LVKQRIPSTTVCAGSSPASLTEKLIMNVFDEEKGPRGGFTLETLQELVGLPVGDARKIYPSIRVTREDGVNYNITMELNLVRLNVHVDAGKISKVQDFG
jgi:hypothetical protein